MKKEPHDMARIYYPEEIVYSAYKRCRCGSGLAYPRNCKDPYYFWSCAYIMTSDLKFRPIEHLKGPFDAGTIEDEEGVIHDGAFSFVFHEIMKETDKITTRDCTEMIPEPVKVKRKSKHGK